VTEVATVPLALDDFVPVVLAGVGAVWLARTTGRDRALLGAVLVLAGGLCKASWKLVLATTGDDVPHVDELLFCLLAPGFALLAAALLADVRSAQAATVSRGADAPVGMTVVAALVLRSTGPLLALTVVASTATGVLAILSARRRDDSTAALLFAVQLVMAYALVPLAGSGQSLAHQWWEQSLNTLGQGAFALGAWRLLHPSRVRIPA
jgi:hypothetical protein